MIALLFAIIVGAFAKETQSGGIPFMPGMKVRAGKGVTDMIKNDLVYYGTAYLNSDW